MAQSYAPPPVTITQNSGGTADGLIFISQIGAPKSAPGQTLCGGPEIVDSQGRPIWFLPVPYGLSTDFRVQTYQGNPVLTWTQGPNFQALSPGSTTDYICDSGYRVIATVQAGDGLNADEHEFQLTPQGTALITANDVLPYDLSSVNGPANGTVLEGVVQEIDIATGQVLFEWHSIDHVPIDQSYEPAPTSPGTAYDYFHTNSVKLAPDGNLIISARHTWTVYKVDHATGAIIWQLGGKRSSFALGPGLPTAWQHNAVPVDSETIRIFDNESNGTPVLPDSRVVWVRHDDTTMTATLLQSFAHTPGISVAAEGNAQALANGDTFVGWGVAGGFTEFNASGGMVYDVAQTQGFSSYRAYRFPWVGAPTGPPIASAVPNVDGSLTVHAIWNGATNVASWRVLGEPAGGTFAPVATAPWNGLDTAITVPGTLTAIEVVALDADGTALATSAPVGGPVTPVTPAITQDPVSRTIATGTTAVFATNATGSDLDYQWYANGLPLVDGASSGASIFGSQASILVIGGAVPGNAGTYTCTVSNAAGTATTTSATLSVVASSDPGRLVNLSGRAFCGAGADGLVLGFIVGGEDPTQTEPLLIRAAGPALAPFGVGNVLADPDLELYSVGGASVLLATNAGWGGDPTIASTARVVGAFSWTNPGSLDSAMVQQLEPGSYTAQIVGATGDSGTVLAELYDATPSGSEGTFSPRLVNASARGWVGTGQNPLTMGFVIGGSTARTVLIRVSGPALAAFGVPGTLADPQLQVFALNQDKQGPVVVAANSGWAGNAEVGGVAQEVGAFPWTNVSSADSAVLVTLPPGAYTAQVSGASGDTGVVLAEVYEVP
ncbi:MAG: arylsulfotransferase family protein [Opitutaceae bacterium]